MGALVKSDCPGVYMGGGGIQASPYRSGDDDFLEEN